MSVTSEVRQRVWDGSVPLEIRLHKGDCRTYDSCEAYLIQCPRVSYLGLLLQRLHAFFSRDLIFPEANFEDAWFEYEGVPLKWHYPLGLIYDLYSGSEAFGDGEGSFEDGVDRGEGKSAWKLTLHFSDYPLGQLVKLDAAGKHLHDLYINSVKEADFLRNGTGKTIMSMTKDDSEQLWDSVQKHDFSRFNPVNQKLLNPQGINLRHVPIKLYLPHASSETTTEEEPLPGSIRVVQTPVTTTLANRTPQTVGTALNAMAPSLFPSRRIPMIAKPVLHGAVLPLTTPVEDLLRVAAYSDGWLHISVVMMV